MKTHIFTLCSGVLLFLGCAQKEIVFTQEKLCQAPIASIILQNIVKKEGNATISQGEFKDYVLEVINTTNCLEIVTEAQENTYALNVTYDLKINNTIDKQILSSENTHTLNAQVTLSISNDKQIRQEVGQSSIEVKDKEILGLGGKDKISRKDEINALKNSLLLALKSFISTLQSN
ncbi:hypothetical protein CQA62_02995 [Helicobacter cholecystus]|uniref:Lipoprotein n=1 Tax=Helicobacter cholecystus TaxID=45498 RepID=A0A3D8IWF9_9HELI|nr:hypothetical protein [Helicobacter cholecystus]RDU69629.1 hypothetical protein CQA62_02995 [Helicobacter cholecystus]VEJ24189.1 Uncharacterised protein [Helicobacter cholecystus]